jgi:uncharacterized pyridoxamine 5'-phosphate oxidase family protein
MKLIQIIWFFLISIPLCIAVLLTIELSHLMNRIYKKKTTIKRDKAKKLKLDEKLTEEQKLYITTHHEKESPSLIAKNIKTNYGTVYSYCQNKGLSMLKSRGTGVLVGRVDKTESEEVNGIFNVDASGDWLIG